MDKTHFDNWLGKRQNITHENMMSRLLWGKPGAAPGTPPPPPALAAPEPAIKRPSDIYTNPEVRDYTHEITNLLGLRPGLEQIDNKGHMVGTWDGTIPPVVQQALMRYVAGHIMGGGEKTSFLWVSYHDAAQVTDWLDSLRRPGSRLSVAEEFHIEDPKSLALWIQTKLPLHQDARYQTNYQTNSDSYGVSRRTKKAGRPSLMDYPELMELARAMFKFVEAANARKDIRSGVSKLHAPLQALIDSFKHAFPGDPSIQSMGLTPTPLAPEAAPTDPADPADGGAPGRLGTRGALPAGGTGAAGSI